MRHTIVLALSLVPLAARAASPQCTPAQMMVVVDHSSSMNGVVDATMQSKWTIAKNAIGQVAKTYENQIDLGLSVFPRAGQCSTGKTLVQPARGNASKIAKALPGAPPKTGNYTPMAQTIDAVACDLDNKKRDRAILLITDGWQWCHPYDAKTRFQPVDAVKRAVKEGIKVYVVGFGEEVDVEALNKMAVAAGTALAGCDPSGTLPASPNKCYYQADSAAQLLMALESVSLKVSQEICDGVDNNCDGNIDENLMRNCANGCGAGTETCQGGVWSGCTAPAPEAEICDGKDNDCNGSTDEGCICIAGQTRDCGPIMGACATSRGTQTCTAQGTWGACVGGTMPQPETCNGIDDDCNGYIDDAPPATLCPNGGVCDVDGTCKDPYNTDGAGTDGCGCSVGARAPRAPLALVLLLAAVAGIVLRRRRAR